MSTVQQHVSRFGVAVAERFKLGGGEPEDLLRGPFEQLLADVSTAVGIADVVPAGEHHLADERVRPDYAIYVAGALVGFVEIKAPGKGVDPRRFRGHDRQQWERLACLPNVLYTDGQTFALFRDGERVGAAVAFGGDVTTAGADLTVDVDALHGLVGAFLSWHPVAPRRPSELAATTARLCRLLRAEVAELMVEEQGLQDLAADWRRLLFPDASDEAFADGYAQTVTFAMLLARIEGIALADRDLRAVSDELGNRHTLIARALNVLTDPAILPKLAVSVTTLQRVLGVVDWATVSRGSDDAWLYFYENFLEGYDPKLRRATGSYYTPVEVVDPMVRMVDDLLRQRLGVTAGLVSDEVTVVDPAVGTGTFLFRTIHHIAGRIEVAEGAGAVGPRLRAAARRLVGFELQAGPYSVAELRLSSELATRGASLRADELRLYLTDTLGNPFIEDEQLAATYRPIAISRRRANEVKREAPVMVVLGNPPYKERSKNEGGWVESGSAGSGEAAPLAAFMPPKEWGLGAHVKHLYNPYIYFWRWATWKVFESHPGDRGVVAFVTVAGFLNGPGFAGLRAYLRRTADAVWVVNCSPEGHQPEVATRIFTGVQQPVCIMIAVRDGSTDADTPAPVRYTDVHGLREEKFAQLAALDLLDDAAWIACPTTPAASFLPEGSSDWMSLPALDELLAWSGSGTMVGRTWPIGPSPEVLRRRWTRLVTAQAEDKPALLAEHPSDRRVDTRLTDNLPGYERKRALAEETDDSDAPVPYAFRMLDREWIIPDKRVINRPNPALWQVRTAPEQLFLTALDAHSPTSGPPLTFAAEVPDLHHYRGSFGGRAWPLWLDTAGTRPNVLPGLLEELVRRYGAGVDVADLVAYLAGVASHSGYLERFGSELSTPGLRIPLTADPALFARVADLGRRAIWLQTFGTRHVDAAAGRPAGAPRVAEGSRPLVTVTIPDDPERMPEEIVYHEDTQTLAVGAGAVAPVSAGAWAYEASGYRVLRRWFARRKREPEGRTSSDLDLIVERAWRPDWTTELLDVVNVVELLVALEPEQDRALAAVMDADLITVGELTAAGVLPAADPRPAPEKPPRQAQL